jgi:hypothetical protein
MSNQLIYPSLGILTNQDGSDPKPILEASTSDNGTLDIKFLSGSVDSMSVKDGKIEPYNNGLVTFTTDDGTSYVIRPLDDTDGEWISDYKVDLPVDILKKMLFKEEGLGQMPYLQNADETMVAFSKPDSEYIFGILYVNKYGAFIRMNGDWLPVSPADATFDETMPHVVNADTADEFVTAYDNGDMTVTDAEKYTTSPEDLQE